MAIPLKVVAFCCVLHSIVVPLSCSFVVPIRKARLIRYSPNDDVDGTTATSLQAKSPLDSIMDGFSKLSPFGGGGGSGGGRDGRSSYNGMPTRTRPGSRTVREIPYFIDPADGNEAPFRDDGRGGRYNANNNYNRNQPPRSRGGPQQSRQQQQQPQRRSNTYAGTRQPRGGGGRRGSERTSERGIPGINQPKPWDGFKNPFSSSSTSNVNRKQPVPTNSLAPRTRQSDNYSNINSNTAPIQRSRPRQQGPLRNVNLSEKARTIWDDVPSIRVQGTVQKTWSFTTGAINRIHIMMRTDGRPLSANVELWRGPDNSPQIMAVYIEDGALRPFNAIVETPGSQNVISIRNTNSLEFPLNAILEAELDDMNIGLEEATQRLEYSGIPPRLVQGGSVYTKGFDYTVASVQIQLKTDGRPLCARIELLQGPNNSKQVMDVYTENGLDYPFFMVVETPGSENVFRVVNTATVEYPLYASLQAYEQAAPAENVARLYSGANSQSAFDVERIL